MRSKFIFMLLCLLLVPAAFAQVAAVGEAQPKIDACIPRATAENPLVLESICENRLDAACSCSGGSGKFSCDVQFNNPPKIVCGDGECTFNFLGNKQANKVSMVSASLLEQLCSSMADAKCACSEENGTVQCNVKSAALSVSCNENGCVLTAGQYSKELNFCNDSNVKRINLERRSDNIDVHVEGAIVKDENGTRSLEDGIVSVSGELGNGIGVDILANLNSMEVGSTVSAQRAQIKENVMERFRNAIKTKFKTEKFNTLDAIEINLTNLKDDENIKSAKIRFRVPKSMVDGEVVIIRYAEDDSVEILTPTVIDRGDFYIYEVDTSGLSLYAVATVNQISEPLAQGATETASNDTSAKACGAVAVILAVLGGLYTMKQVLN